MESIRCLVQALFFFFFLISPFFLRCLKRVFLPSLPVLSVSSFCDDNGCNGSLFFLLLNSCHIITQPLLPVSVITSFFVFLYSTLGLRHSRFVSVCSASCQWALILSSCLSSPILPVCALSRGNSVACHPKRGAVHHVSLPLLYHLPGAPPCWPCQ